jgi:hypothetical protein
MTLQDFINTYTGKIIGDGQCGTLVRQYWIDVDKTDPPSYPDAKDYWFNPSPPYIHTDTPQSGDIAVYNGHDAFPEGHIAVYVGPEVFEQNADPDGSPAHLFQRANTYLLGYLTKEVPMPTDAQIDQWISLFYQEAYGAAPPDAIFNQWRPVLKNNFTEGSLSIMEGTDTNPGALKNKSGATTLIPGLYKVN